MTLLQWEDFADAPADEAAGPEAWATPADGVWAERTVRILTTKDCLGKSVEEILRDGDYYTVDTTRSAQLGEPAKCPCGRVAIRYGIAERVSLGEPFYPWGRDRYGKRDETHVVAGQYCPACDGGEHV